MLTEHKLCGQQTFADSGDSAETERNSGAADRIRKFLYGPVSQKLEHETLVQREVQVVQADIDLIDSLQRYEISDRCRRTGRLEGAVVPRPEGFDVPAVESAEFGIAVTVVESHGPDDTGLRAAVRVPFDG